MELIKKMLGREWLGTVGMLTVASVLVLKGQISFEIWAAFCGSVFTAYQGIKKAGEVRLVRASAIRVNGTEETDPPAK